MRILITGASGSMGYYLARHIQGLNEGHVVYGMGRQDASKVRLTGLDYYKASNDMRPDIAPDIVFHVAGNAHVKDSFESVHQFISDNVSTTATLLDWYWRWKPWCDAKPKLVLCSCHDEETELVTRRGIIRYTDIRPEDEVVSFNPLTETVEFRPISRIVVNDYTGPMVRIKGRWIDQFVTPNHKLLFKAQKNLQWRFKEVQDIKRRENMLYFPRGIYNGGITAGQIRVGSKRLNTNDVFYFLGLYIGDGFSDIQIKRQKNKSGLNRAEYLKAAKVVGTGRFRAFVSQEGGNEYSTSVSHRVFLAIPEKDKARIRALSCIKRLGFDPRAYASNIFFSSKDFVEFLDQVGHSAKIKHIPEWVFSYSAHHLKYLYDGLIDSDGYRVKRDGRTFCERLTTISARLADQFAVLCTLLGKSSTTLLVHNKVSHIDGRPIKSSPAYYVTASELDRNITGQNFADEQYTGKVWCLEIDGLHNFAIRRNGRITFSGNSSEVYGNVPQEQNPIREEQSADFPTCNPYAATKAMQEILCSTYARIYGFPLIITRAFGYINPRRSDLVATALARQIVEVERGKFEGVVHGDLRPVRSFADARDIAEAYWLAATKCEPGVYNIGSEEACSINGLLESLKRISGNNTPSRMTDNLTRPTDLFYCVPDCAKFRAATGWRPKHTLDESLKWLLEEVRNAVS